MIVHNPVSDTLLIKPNNSQRVFEINKYDKSEIRRSDFLLANEGLALDIPNQLIYLGDNDGNIKTYKYSDFSLVDSFTVITLAGDATSEVEGMLIDPIDGALLINADAYLHGNNNNGNTLFVFDLQKTIKKYIQFPNMFDFGNGFFSGGLKLVDNKLVGSGSWESQIFDFETFSDYLTNEISLIKNNNVTVEYRGLNTAPTSDKINYINGRSLDIYSFWGDTIPNSYQNTVANFRYLQIKLTL